MAIYKVKLKYRMDFIVETPGRIPNNNYKNDCDYKLLIDKFKNNIDYITDNLEDVFYVEFEEMTNTKILK